jgi:hypothetical protein
MHFDLLSSGWKTILYAAPPQTQTRRSAFSFCSGSKCAYSLVGTSASLAMLVDGSELRSPEYLTSCGVERLIKAARGGVATAIASQFSGEKTLNAC